MYYMLFFDCLVVVFGGIVFVMGLFVFGQCDFEFDFVFVLVYCSGYDCVVIVFDFVDQFVDFVLVQQQFVFVLVIGYYVGGGLD